MHNSSWPFCHRLCWAGCCSASRRMGLFSWSQVGQGVIYMQVQVPDMFGSELAAALDFDGGANNLINLIQNNLIKVRSCVGVMLELSWPATRQRQDLKRWGGAQRWRRVGCRRECCASAG